MRPDDIVQLVRKKPFRPFRMVLTTNTVYEIRHPELLAVSRSVVTIGFPAPQAAVPVADRVIGVALIHIVQYELLPLPGELTANGQS